MSEQTTPTSMCDVWQHKTCEQVPGWVRVTMAGVISAALLAVGFVGGVVVMDTGQSGVEPNQEASDTEPEQFIAQPAAQSREDRAAGGIGDQLTAAGVRVTVTEVAEASQFENRTADGSPRLQYPGRGNKFIIVSADLEHRTPSPRALDCAFAIRSELIDQHGRFHQPSGRLCHIVDGPDCPDKPGPKYGSVMVWAFEVPKGVTPGSLKFAEPADRSGSYTLVSLRP